MVGPFLWVPILLALSVAWPLFRQAGFQLSGGAILWQGVFVVVGLGSSILVARRQRMRRLGIAMATFNQLTVIGAAAMMMAYVAATSGRPLVDDALLRFDQAIGYEWSAYGRFFVENRMFALIVLPAYFTMMLQPFVLIAVLSVAGRTAALEKYVLATFLSLGVTVALFALYPATTAWAHLGISDLELEAYHYLPRTGEG